MKLTVFLKALNAHDSKMAKRFQKHVRELEEESKGRFIAFVDDGKDSFDVCVELSETKDIIGKTCDCPQVSPFCSHINAVCLAILEIDKPKKKARKKKPNKFQEMVAQAEPNDVLEWLAAQMKTDKLLAKKFEIDFVRKDSLTVESLKEIHKDLLSSVNGKKRTISAVHAGKVIKLYEPIHNRIYDKQIQKNISTQEVLDLIIEMRASVVQLHYMSKSSGKRIVGYLNKLLEKTNACIQLMEKDAQLGLVKLLNEKNNLLKLSIGWATPMMLGMQNIDDNVKIEYVQNILKTEASKLGTRRKNEKLFSSVKDSEIIAEVIEDFPLEERHIEYNLELVEKLMLLKKYEIAVKYCLTVIDFSSDYYGQVFFINMINALLELDDKDRLFKYGKKYFRKFATLEIYQLLRDIAPNALELEEFYKICKNIKPYNFYDKNEAALILMAVFNDHGKILKVFEIMKRFEVWDLPFSFSEILIAQDKDIFIKIYLDIGNRFWEMDNNYYSQLFFILDNHFTKKQVEKLQKSYADKRLIRDVLEEYFNLLNER